ncbi:hypothetical protein HDG33_004480 [Paraburkholderia sp. Cpub6]|nr:hypothetical protein [Paraburkholderia sp. Cpub6]
MYVTINRWDAKYAVLATLVTVELSYALKSGTTAETLWTHRQTMVYSPQAANAGKSVPLAQQANAISVNKAGQGLPAGPYDGQYKSDGASF